MLHVIPASVVGAGMLECSSARVRECWSTEGWECQSAGVVGSSSPECWSPAARWKSPSEEKKSGKINENLQFTEFSLFSAKNGKNCVFECFEKKNH